MYQLHLKPLAPDLCTAVAIPLQYKFTDLSSNEHLVQIDNIYQLVQSGVIYQSVTISINLDFLTVHLMQQISSFRQVWLIIDATGTFVWCGYNNGLGIIVWLG